MEIKNFEFKFRDTKIKNIDPPCSLYSVLLENKLIDDPFYRDNEYKTCELSREDCSFETEFEVKKEDLEKKYRILRFFGLDTICDIYLNDHMLAQTDNMHRTYDIDTSKFIKEGKNKLFLYFHSPILEMERLQKQHPLKVGEDCLKGVSQIRKAFCMSGWDWGPKLPDMGIWRKIEFLAFDYSLDNFKIIQHHRENSVTLDITPEIIGDYEGDYEITAEKDDKVYTASRDIDGNYHIEISDPQIWWPNGYGDQPLYTVTVKTADGRSLSKKIGLRTVTVENEPDEYGRGFVIIVNGKKIFAMGGDYIPMDNILARVTEEKTERLLKDCIKANYNCIRVWGGAYFPEDYFYDLCDKYGLLIWQDFMIACYDILLSSHMKENISAELKDNIRRIRHHASIGLFCGNNEVEEMMSYIKGGPYNAHDKYRDYFELYQTVMPEIVYSYSPQIFYWPSSPSSDWCFRRNAQDENCGDQHFWTVWHGNKPFEEYRKHYFRFLSEFGFQSFPGMKTIRSFAEEKDLNPFSKVMESHQKSGNANLKILSYASENYLYAKDMEDLSYISQLNQADAMRYGVEHMRRHRERCKGALYWQLNDCWPVASWSSIDYFGRWKALHYFAKRFFAPVLLSAEDTGTKIKLNLSNETLEDFEGTVKWMIVDNSNKLIASDEFKATCRSLESEDKTTLYLDEFIKGHEEERVFITELYSKNNKKLSSSTVLFCKAKRFEFKTPDIKTEVFTENGQTKIKISSDCFTYRTELDFKEADSVLSDNYFDIYSKEPVIITVLDLDEKTVKEQLTVKTINHIS